MNNLDSRFLGADPMRRVIVHDLAAESLTAQIRETTAAPLQTTTATGTEPTRTPATRRQRWTVVALASAVLIPVGGLGVAGAAGVLPQPFLDALGAQQSYGTDAGTASLAGSLPGPSGQRFEAWRTTGPGGAICLSTWYVPATGTVGSAPASLRGGAGVCSSGAAPAAATDLFSSRGASGGDGTYILSFSAGSATSATLTLSDGTQMPTLVTDGWIVGWFPASPTSPAPTLTAFDATGEPLASTTVTIPTGVANETD